MRLIDHPYLRPAFEPCPASHQTQLLCPDHPHQTQLPGPETQPMRLIDHHPQFCPTSHQTQLLYHNFEACVSPRLEAPTHHLIASVRPLSDDRVVEFDEMLDRTVGDDRSDTLVEFQGQEVEFDVDDLDIEVEFDETLDKAQTLDEDMGNWSDALVEEPQQSNFQNGEPSVGEPYVGEINTSSAAPPYKTRSGRMCKPVDKFSPTGHKTKSRKL
ncbi:unnamed protein product [Arabis nemorensis]|uniref:Uncharacterized protein n=1 Tax=Arabis nemorensis TaxID=586526 RepID=A0A565AV76_9BRAS|nr:unnamed protein product [Arabis nemorensis]